MPTRGPTVGEVAPDFELEGTDGRFRLSARRGAPVVLLFYPGDETPTCTKQFCSYRDEGAALAELGAAVVGISSQSLDSHRRFRARHGLTVPLLADVDQRVARAYGVTIPGIGALAALRALTTRRAVFVIDAAGIVRHRHVHALGLTYPTLAELRAAVTALPGARGA